MSSSSENSNNSSDLEVPEAWSLRRYSRRGQSITASQAVTTLDPSLLDVSKLRTVPVPAHDPAKSRSACPYHIGCAGHLILTEAGGYALPFCCLVDSRGVTDRRGYLNLKLMRDETTPGEFAEELMKTCMGKKGLVRNLGMGMTPTTSVRGVAVPYWDQDPTRSGFPPRGWPS